MELIRKKTETLKETYQNNDASEMKTEMTMPILCNVLRQSDFPSCWKNTNICVYFKNVIVHLKWLKSI